MRIYEAVNQKSCNLMIIFVEVISIIKTLTDQSVDSTKCKYAYEGKFVSLNNIVLTTLRNVMFCAQYT